MIGACFSWFEQPEAVVLPKLEPVVVHAEPINIEQLQFEQEEINCLATNIYFEARSEGETSQAAVAQVTVNRAKSKRFPNTICGVVYQAEYSEWYLVNHNRLVPKRNRCQFSWYCDGKPDTIKDANAYAFAYALANDIYKGEYPKVVSDNTLFYHADYVKPTWAMTMAKHEQIGTHIFYNYY